MADASASVLHPPLVDAAAAGPNPPPIEPTPSLPAAAASSASEPLSLRRGERATGILDAHYEKEEAARRRELAKAGKDKRSTSDA